MAEAAGESAPDVGTRNGDAPNARTEEPRRAPAAEAAAERPAERAPEVRAEPAAAPAMPRPAPFVLPLADLQALAATAGLEWVGSDAEKVNAAQAAIAAAPKPVHVPREPRPPVTVDEGPLVLVETRKDLSQMKLPFEAAAAAAQE
jgi:ribonuclease E